MDYEEKRLEFSEWPDFKLTTPFGQVPILNHNSQDLCQSGPIVRFLARKFGLAGDGEAGAALADVAYEHCNDFYNEWRKARHLSYIYFSHWCFGLVDWLGYVRRSLYKSASLSVSE